LGGGSFRGLFYFIFRVEFSLQLIWIREGLLYLPKTDWALNWVWSCLLSILLESKTENITN
jgi:hypothetical protein